MRGRLRLPAARLCRLQAALLRTLRYFSLRTFPLCSLLLAPRPLASWVCASAHSRATLPLSPRGLAELHSLGFCVAPCGAAGCPAHASCVASRQIFARCATQPRRRGPLTTSPKGARCCRAAGSKRPAFLFLLWLDLTVWLSRTHCIETTTHSNQSKRYIKTSKPVSQTAPFGDLHHAPRLYGLWRFACARSEEARKAGEAREPGSTEDGGSAQLRLFPATSESAALKALLVVLWRPTARLACQLPIDQ